MCVTPKFFQSYGYFMNTIKYLSKHASAQSGVDRWVAVLVAVTWRSHAHISEVSRHVRCSVRNRIRSLSFLPSAASPSRPETVCEDSAIDSDSAFRVSHDALSFFLGGHLLDSERTSTSS